MTREKQIDEFAYSQVDCEFFDERLHEGIIIGAKWADEHPKSDMVNKQEFIAKLEKWIKNNTNWTDEYIWDGRNPDYGLWNELKKFMEE